MLPMQYVGNQSEQAFKLTLVRVHFVLTNRVPTHHMLMNGPQQLDRFK